MPVTSRPARGGWIEMDVDVTGRVITMYVPSREGRVD